MLSLTGLSFLSAMALLLIIELVYGIVVDKHYSVDPFNGNISLSMRGIILKGLYTVFWIALFYLCLIYIPGNQWLVVLAYLLLEFLVYFFDRISNSLSLLTAYERRTTTRLEYYLSISFKLLLLGFLTYLVSL